MYLLAHEFAFPEVKTTLFVCKCYCMQSYGSYRVVNGLYLYGPTNHSKHFKERGVTVHKTHDVSQHVPRCNFGTARRKKKRKEKKGDYY